MAAEDNPIEHFTEAELTALARMLVTLLRVDGKVSPDEHEALRMFAERVRLGNGGGASPYRLSADDSADGVATLQPFLERASHEPSGRDAFALAAESITRRDAREAIYVALRDVAAADTIVEAEWELLEMLFERWGLGTA